MPTNSDKARDKLLESMRISKGGISKTPDDDKPAGTAPKKTSKKSVTRNKPASRKTTKPASKSTSTSSRAPGPSSRPAGFSGYSSRSGFSTNDPYQDGERIWPD